MEVGRRKKEEAIKSIASAINNVLTVLAVAIFDFPFIPRKVRRSDSRLWYSVRTLQLTVNSQQSTVNSQQSTINSQQSSRGAYPITDKSTSRSSYRHKV